LPESLEDSDDLPAPAAGLEEDQLAAGAPGRVPESGRANPELRVAVDHCQLDQLLLRGQPPRVADLHVAKGYVLARPRCRLGQPRQHVALEEFFRWETQSWVEVVADLTTEERRTHQMGLRGST